MQKIIEFKTETKNYKIKEFKVRQILELKDELEKSNFIEVIRTSIEKISDIKQEDLLDFSMSEMEELIKIVLKVNESFFLIPEAAGLGKIAKKMKENFEEAFLKDVTKTV